ncbi:MAG: GTPase HflX [Candidatus Omnitrophica bacterium]|nr:GTPase HflX [Candidatus Omnitrophota bacterium]
MSPLSSAERALLVTIELERRFNQGAPWPIEDEANELRELVASAGCRVASEVQVRRHTPVSATFLGSGKLEELAALAVSERADVAILNQELSPAQQRNIEEALDIKTIDRTQLILDIFAQRATSQEGKVQVELAQLQYLLPRLVGKSDALSRLGGGIGTRGPGEQKLEVDRRRIRQRISRLKGELDKMAQRRDATRQRRKEVGMPVVALVGYTNAGKSTLLNRLTKAGTVVENRLFTTLDPLARRLRFASGQWVVVTDTVGFLHRLPHHLVEAFKATLEEAQDADVLLHVLDAGDPLVMEHAEAVQSVLRMLELANKPLLTVLNKVDRVEHPQTLIRLENELLPAVPVSALHGQGIDELLATIQRMLNVPADGPS